MISITSILLYGLNGDCPEHGAARAFVLALSDRTDVAIAELVLLELDPNFFATPLCSARRSGPTEARVNARPSAITHAGPSSKRPR